MCIQREVEIKNIEKSGKQLNEQLNRKKNNSGKIKNMNKGGSRCSLVRRRETSTVLHTSAEMFSLVLKNNKQKLKKKDINTVSFCFCNCFSIFLST